MCKSPSLPAIPSNLHKPKLYLDKAKSHYRHSQVTVNRNFVSGSLPAAHKFESQSKTDKSKHKAQQIDAHMEAEPQRVPALAVPRREDSQRNQDAPSNRQQPCVSLPFGFWRIGRKEFCFAPQNDQARAGFPRNIAPVRQFSWFLKHLTRAVGPDRLFSVLMLAAAPPVSGTVLDP